MQRFPTAQRLLLPILAAVITGCAGPAPHASNGETRSRAAALAMCAQKTALALGAEVATVHDFEPTAQSKATALGIGDGLQVVAIRSGSPAQDAGLRVGDVLEAIDGVLLTGGPRARETFLSAAEVFAPQRLLRVRRDGAELSVAVPLRSACTTNV